MGAWTRARAAVFDMDGTLVDNMAFHADAWVAIARERLGLEVPRERFLREFAGKKNEEIIPVLAPGLSRPEVSSLALEKEEAYRALYRPHLRPLAGLGAFLERLRAAGVVCAVATAAPPGNRDLVLDGLELRGVFAHVIGAEDAPRGKPFPDIYLAAARALAVAPGECVAFEDAANGVLSARAAGMPTLGLLTSTTREALLDAGAAWVVPDFQAVPGELERLLFG